MFEKLLKEQIRGDPHIVGMLATYKGRPAFFYQKAPQDTDRGWGNGSFPRIDYTINNQYDPERKVSGIMEVNIWCNAESPFMPEDIEARFVELVNGTFYSGQSGNTVCAIWNRSDAFDFEVRISRGNNTAPEGFGMTAVFDLLEFPLQITTDPDPIEGLNAWTKTNFPDMRVIHLDQPPALWKPTDQNPAIYWRFEGMASTDRQSYAVTWYNGSFAAHVIAETVTQRNRWTKAIIERIQLYGRVFLPDNSPMFVKQVAVRHGADPLREGQLLLTGQYGVLEQHDKEEASMPLNRATFTKEPLSAQDYRLEVTANG